MKILRAVFFISLLFNNPWAHATSFDCNKGRSAGEQLICRTTDLSKLDDVLGKLYRRALHSVANPKAFCADSDSKWTWREANCTDESCLRSWYTGRIEELQLLLAGLQLVKPVGPATPSHDSPGDADTLGASAWSNTERSESRQTKLSATALQCTAADPDITSGDQCSIVMTQSARWRYVPPDGDWFCATAMVSKAVR